MNRALPPASLSKLDRIAIAALILVAVAQIGAFIAMPFDGYDSPSHLFWVSEWRHLWQAGMLYPRWLPNSYHGFGAPSFYLYPPLAYMISSAVGLLLPAVGAMTLIKIVTLLTLALSGLAMYLYLRWRNANAPQSMLFLASVIFAFAPYRFFNMTVRAAFSEHVAFMFVPLAFWGLDMILRERKATRRFSPIGFLLLSVSIALLFITNLPTAACVLLMLGTYLVVDREGQLFKTGLLTSAATVGLLLAAFYLWPVATYYHSAQLARLWMPFPFMQSTPILGIFTSQAVMINAYGLLMLLGGLGLLVTVRSRSNAFRSDDRFSSWFWLLAGVVVLQIPPFSIYPFLHVFPFTIIQLPARLNSVLLVLMAVVWADHLSRREHWRTTSYVVLLWSLCMVPLIIVQLSGIHLRAREIRLPDDPPEYATRWSPPYDSLAKARMAQDTGWTVKGATILNATHVAYHDTIVYDSPNDVTLTLHRAYWPLWQANIEGSSMLTSPDSLGRLTLKAPAGHHTVTTQLTESSSETLGRWISLGAFVALCVFLLGTRRHTKTN
ncbi:MAG: hypothetical protein Q8922_05630 [Bacteroidota bacterium]|nr:hypothetical protein [Bacteroidota bacterium]MDP4233116.1 hypothetical protein [Bacteroidota bacterium]MDP4241739.1 hypothetical protein [Bacteroidota bacterium]MDP4287397.1 hypothetical protein [Bacteroidota bacterium]